MPANEPPDVMHLPEPPVHPETGKIDAELYQAWKQHMIQGFEQNSKVFSNVLEAFMRPYWLTVWMYRLMFFVGICGFILAIVMSVWKGLEIGALFGGLTVVSFLAYFIGRPLQSLEQNIILITWLGVLYNTYWSRLMQTSDPGTVQKDLDKITKDTIDGLVKLADKHAELSGKRPGPGE